jgi:hypothetical protein
LGCLPVWSVLRRPLFATGISLEIRDKQAADQLEKSRQKFFKSMRGQTLKSG